MIAIGSGLTIGQLLEQQIAAAKATQNSLAMKMVSENGRSKQEKTFEQAIRQAAGTENVTLTEAAQTKPVSLEDMLKKKYPNLVYHVLDASSPDWRRRNDYPHYLLYQENLTEEQISQIENWKPSGANPFYGSKDGQFIAPKEIKALQSVPPGSKAVVIHPKVQEKMEQDPDYAEEIYQRIEAWWAFDTARNEAMMPGITARSSMCVAIGEDGLNRILKAALPSLPVAPTIPTGMCSAGGTPAWNATTITCNCGSSNKWNIVWRLAASLRR